jgi:hypothetical protein
MVRNTDGHARTVTRIVAWVAAGGVVATVLALGSACTELRGSIGEDCLKDQDCLSGVCSELHCAPQPPLLDAAFAPTIDAGVDATLDAGARDGSVVAPADGGTPPPPEDAPAEVREAAPDVGTAGPSDASEDVVDGGHSDAPTDGPNDAIADAGEAG